MPFVRVEMRKGKSPAYKKAVLDEIHNALVEAIQIPEDDRTQRLYELGPEDFEFPEARRDDLIIIEITLFAGRSSEAKRRLYKCVTDRLGQNPGIAPRNIAVVLHDVPRENWGFAGVASDKINLGFKVEV